MQIKKITFYSLIFILIGQCLRSAPLAAQAGTIDPGIQVMGKMQGLKHGSVLQITYIRLSRKYEFDSCTVKNGSFSFTKSIQEPTVAIITLDDQSSPKKGYVNCFLVPGKTTIDLSKGFSMAEISGASKTANSRYSELLSDMTLANREHDQLAATFLPLRAENNSAMRHALDSLGQIQDERVFTRFIKNNGDSPVALYALIQYAANPIKAPRRDMEPGKVLERFAYLAPAVAGSEPAIAFHKLIRTAEKTSIGAQAPQMSSSDTSGKPINLASFRGKYVLVDFWASWCRPCRAEHPHLREVYKSFHDKGFEILSVSIDAAGGKRDWIKAIREDNLIWPQASDLMGNKGPSAQNFGISAIPMNFLIDPNGIIIAKGLRGAELGDKLRSILK
jgi:peroxiredoxin